MDNKIADITGTTSGWKIKYATSLLRETAAKWVLIYVDEKENTIFHHYRDFWKAFLERFTDPNPAGIAMEKLLNLRRGKMEIQEFATKMINLAHQAKLEDSAIKALIFRGLYSQDQDRVMLANSIKTEKEMQEESVEAYLERIIRLLRWKEVRRQGARESDQAGGTIYKPVTWNQGEDPMDLDKIDVQESRKCFKCGKPEHIRHFCKKKALVAMESGNEKLLAAKRSQKKDLW